MKYSSKCFGSKLKLNGTFFGTEEVMDNKNTYKKINNLFLYIRGGQSAAL